MTDYQPLFSAENVDTPVGLAPELILSGITGVPAHGTGLSGAVYVPGTSINSIAALVEVIATSTPNLTFTASELLYTGTHSGTTVAEFLDDDAASLDGDGDAFEMGPSGLTFTGYIFIPAGLHEISVNSDDGFALKIGGIDYSTFGGVRSEGETARVADFDGGLYQIELLYFDAWGRQELSLEIDGLPVDQSAFYLEIDDFLNPAPGTPIVPVADYHPSYFLGEEVIDDPETLTGTENHDVIEGLGGDDMVDGLGGDDQLYGGYGDDKLIGGDGDDLLDGGRGSDLLIGGDGDDLLISRSDAGEQRIGQLAVGAATRGDPDNEVNQDRQKLKGYEGQPLVGDDILVGGAGRDTFLIAPQINAKLDIIQKHVRDDGTINWAGVAGENNELHDHWVDSSGIDVIADYNSEEDLIAVIGHTANVFVDYRDTDGDGDDESIVTVISQQGGGGGAHTLDLIGQVIVHGDRVEAEDIVTDAGVTYGIVETIGEVAEAIFPVGDLKTTEINGETVYGYDTRGPGDALGAVTGNPEDNIDNPYLAEVTFADPTEPGAELTRYPFEQLGTQAIVGETENGGSGNDVIAPTAPDAGTGLPGALGYWSFADGADGAFTDARGGPSAKAYTLFENQAILRTDGLSDGPDGTPNAALTFNGEDEYAFLAHDAAYQITQGTIATWIRPDDLSQNSIVLSKDQSGAGDGGHFRLGHTCDGGLFLRFATGDGGANSAWETTIPNLLTEGEWSHLAVSFTETGVTVYLNGAAVPDFFWNNVEGNVETPGAFEEAYLLNNQEPWVIGADTSHAEQNDTAAQFATDAEDLRKPFEGAIADFGIWGGFEPGDALGTAEVAELFANGPGTALTQPSGPQPMLAGDDVFSGGAGNDIISGEAGNDELSGDDGADTIEGGYGDDLVDGGDGNDILNGGRGSDLLIGGAGNDTLISLSDVGEDRAGQLVLGAPSRDFPDPSISNEYLKLIDWIDQPLIGDDVLVGGEGEDLFYFGTLINAKLDIIMEHVNDDRTIDWAGVAGENNRIHDHWVDGIGIEIIADYNADEDTIAVIGHTTNVRVDYKLTDTDADGVDDEVVSVITVYSQQGANGGAHDEDYLGYIIVHGDLVNEEDIVTSSKVTFGIVDTIDQLQEALAPTGDTKISIGPNGEELFGYDTRDVDGDPIGTDPEAFSSNTFLDSGLVTFADPVPGDLPSPAIVMQHDGGSFGGQNALTIQHSAEQSQETGTWAFSFTADSPGGTNQALLSKDHVNFKDGGHLTFWITDGGHLKVRIQSTNESFYLGDFDDHIVAGEEYHVAFTFDEDSLRLYINGVLVDAADGFAGGMLGNIENTVLGASTQHRNGDDDNLEWFFDGEIGDLLTLDRPLEPVEALLLASAGGDPASIIHEDTDPGTEDITGPVITAADGNLAEGETATGISVSATDPSGPVTLSVTGGDYTIVDGELVRSAQADYDESLGGAQVELVELTATDGLGNSTTTTINVTIDNDLADDDITGPAITAADGNLVEGETATGIAVSAADPSGPVTLSVTGGDYTIVDGELVRSAQADYDESLGGGQVELVELMATDGLGNSTTATINVTIDNDPTDDDTADDDTSGPVITANDGNLLEGETATGIAVSAIDPSGPVTLSVTGTSYTMVDGELVRSAQADYDESLGGEQVELVELMATDELGNSTKMMVNVTIDNDPADDDTTGDDTTEITQIIGDDGRNRLKGTAEDELIDGQGGKDRLIGKGGDDVLLGGLGNDRLIGGSGADFLNGGLGRDVLRGGADEDEFFFDTSGADNFDKVAGFEIGIDTIVLDGATFGISGESFSDVFALGNTATDVDDRILYDSSRGRLFYDADGSGDGAAELIARLGRGFELSVTDFEVV